MPFCTRRSTSTCGVGDAAMTGVTLRLDGPRWREHLRTVAGAAPGLVPVIKGNGYGYGLRRLAQESAAAGCRHDRGWHRPRGVRGPGGVSGQHRDLAPVGGE